VVTISGSPSISSRLSGVLDFVHSRLEQHNVQVGWTNVRDLPAEDLLYARVDSPSIVALNRQIEQADAVIVASPVYKASYTGLLKACLDLLP
jgi:FMN reductase